MTYGHRSMQQAKSYAYSNIQHQYYFQRSLMTYVTLFYALPLILFFANNFIRNEITACGLKHGSK
jgi:hypothetical protein